MISSMTMPSESTVAMLARGMDCLVKNMGVVDAENFIATVKRENFDYTEWQRVFFDKYSSAELVSEIKTWAAEREKRGVENE